MEEERTEAKKVKAFTYMHFYTCLLIKCLKKKGKGETYMGSRQRKVTLACLWTTKEKWWSSGRKQVFLQPQQWTSKILFLHALRLWNETWNIVWGGTSFYLHLTWSRSLGGPPLVKYRHHAQYIACHTHLLTWPEFHVEALHQLLPNSGEFATVRFCCTICKIDRDGTCRLWRRLRVSFPCKTFSYLLCADAHASECSFFRVDFKHWWYVFTEKPVVRLWKF